MANEISVPRASRPLPPIEYPVTPKREKDQTQMTSEKSDAQHSPSMSTAQMITGNSDELRDAVKRLNQLTGSVQRELHFTVDEETGRSVIKVIDSESKEVIKEIPPEEILSLIACFEKFNNGLVEEKA